VKISEHRRWSFATALALAACVIVAPGASRSEDWAGISKKLRDKCEKFNQSVKDMTAKATMTVNTPEGEMKSTVTTLKKGERFRAEIEMEAPPGGEELPAVLSGQTIVVGDATRLWMVHPLMGKIEVPASEVSQYTQQWYCETTIPQAAEVTGSEAVGGRDCHIVLVKDPSAPFTKLWFDKETMDLLKMEGKGEDGDPLIFLMADFRKFGDDRAPYRTEMYKGKERVATIVVESIQLNKGLSDDLFDVDKVVSGMPSASDMMKKMMEQEETTPQEEDDSEE
jgi:outer membrane lipoprotein-sorting protein